MIKKDIFRGNVKEQLKASAKDRLYGFVMADGMIRGGCVNATSMVREMRANHGLGVVETLVLGQGYIAAALLTATMKGKDRIRLTIDCSGPVKGMDVESNVFGEVRGFLKNPGFSAEASGNEKKVSPFFGAGFLTVTRYLEGAKTPYSGQITLEYGDLARDLANYFVQSEQTPTAFSLSVSFDKKGEVTGAGGLFLQAMPGADETVLADAEEKVGSIGSIGEAMAGEVAPRDLVREHFASFSPDFLKDDRVAFFCRCSRDKMQGHLASLPRKDIVDILDNGPFPVEIICHNCSSRYQFTREELETMKQ
ncbi:MAG TPA: Hsp33 family molecular chaperone HslO [Desulfobacteraceae bacterium]|nr:Hsp33 family molecular chaperone HslO [Desulfobacteraceae bacterium]